MGTYLILVITGALLGGVYLLMAAGLNLIYGVMKVVNLAHGDFILIGGLLAFSLFAGVAVNPLAAIPLAAVLLFAIGGVFERGVLSRLNVGSSTGELRTLLATFGLAYVVSNTAFLIWGSRFKSVPYLQGGLDVGFGAIRESLVVAAGIAVAITVGVGLWLGRTESGRAVRATAQSELGAMSCGLNLPRIRMLTFALGSAMAGAAGVLAIIVQPLQSTSSGSFLTVQAFTVIALGGLGNYAGAFLAAELLGIVSTLASYWLGAEAGVASIYVLFIATLTLRPQGLFGRAARV